MARPLKNRISRCPIPHNWTYKNTGHVFQGRYKATIVDKDSYLPELCRYVASNHVRAHVVHGYTLKEIADYLDFHYATVSRAIKRIGTDNV